MKARPTACLALLLVALGLCFGRAPAHAQSEEIVIPAQMVDRIIYVANAIYHMDRDDTNELTALAVCIDKTYSDSPNTHPGILQRLLLQAQDRFDKRYRSSVVPGTYRYYMSPFDILTNMFNILSTQPGNPVAGAMLNESVGFVMRAGYRLGQDTDWLEMSNAVGRVRASGGFEEYRNVALENIHTLGRTNFKAMQVIDVLFSRLFNADTQQTAQMIVSANPEFSQNPNIAPIIQLIQPDGTIHTTLAQARSIIRSFYDRMEQVADTNLNVLQSVNQLQSNYAASFYDPNAVTQIRNTIQTTINNNRPALVTAGAATYITPFTMAPDPSFTAYKQSAAVLRMGAKVAQVTGEILGGVQQGNDGKAVGATGQGFKAAAAGLDLAAATLDVAAAFGAFGKSTEGAILDGVNKLSSQLQQVQQQLNERLDRIDQNILTMYTEMNSQFAEVKSLLVDIGSTLDLIQLAVRSMQSTLLETQAAIDRLTQNIYVFELQAGRADLKNDLREADIYARNDLFIERDDYIRLYSRMYGFSIDNCVNLQSEIGPAVLNRDYDDYSVARELASVPNPEWNINYLIEFARVRFNQRQFPGTTINNETFPGDTQFTQINPLIPTGSRVANPKSWEMSVAGMLRLAAHAISRHQADPNNNPDYFLETTRNDTANSNTGFYGARTIGRLVQTAVAAVTVQGANRSPLFANLLLNHRSKADRLDAILRALEKEGGQSWSNSGQQQAIVDRIKTQWVSQNPAANGIILQNEAKAYKGSKMILDSFIQFGLSRTLESHDLLKSLIFSDQKLPDDAQVRNLYFNWQAGQENPRETFLRIEAERLRALTDILNNSLTEAEAAARFGSRFGEPLAALDAMIQRMEAVTMPRVTGKVRAAQGQLIPDEPILLTFRGSVNTFTVAVLPDAQNNFSVAVPDDSYLLFAKAPRFLQKTHTNSAGQQEPIITTFGNIPSQTNKVTIDLKMLVGDISGDNKINNTDLILLRNAWGTSGILIGDINQDDSVDVLDLDLLLQAFDAVLGDPNYNPQADLNHDDSVDVLDLDLLIQNFDKSGIDPHWNPLADLNGDNVINDTDMNLLLANWGKRGDQ